MNATIESSGGFKPLGWKLALLFALIAIAGFQVAYLPKDSGLGALAIIGYVVGLVQLARLRTTRQSFYWGLTVGCFCFGPQLAFFWRLFGPSAVGLWIVLAFWTGLFVALAHQAISRFGPTRGAFLIPFLWTGLEYFRSELYYLKFSWLNVGYAFSGISDLPWRHLGVFGFGFVIVGLAAIVPGIKWRKFLPETFIEWVVCVALLMIFAAKGLTGGWGHTVGRELVMAGIQLEFPDESQLVTELDQALFGPNEKSQFGSAGSTNIDMVVLPEYALSGEPSADLKAWCQRNQKFLVVGGKDSAPGANFFNTAYVVSTNGEVVFKQVKCTPIQFFKDGLPAAKQELWNSPWGKIGICICYDLSYTRVTDELVRQGAQLLIVPTMDVEDWGRHQHELHARIAPVRAAEYGVPIFRVASSGISQGVSRHGQTWESAPFPGPGEIISFGPYLPNGGSRPWDRWLAPLCVGVTAIFSVWLGVTSFRRKPSFAPAPQLT